MTASTTSSTSRSRTSWRAGRSIAHIRSTLTRRWSEGLYQRIALVTGKEWTPAAEAEWRQDIIDFYGDGADEELFCVPVDVVGRLGCPRR